MGAGLGLPPTRPACKRKGCWVGPRLDPFPPRPRCRFKVRGIQTHQQEESTPQKFGEAPLVRSPTPKTCTKDILLDLGGKALTVRTDGHRVTCKEPT